ncbi:hypothetical protein Tco_1425149 [Tanacetum coccineum]
MRSSYPIFDKEQKLLVSSITVAQLGVSNKGYPDKDEKIECTPPTIDDLLYSFMEVLAGSSKIGTSPRQKDKIKINYCSKKLLIYSKFHERIDEVELKIHDKKYKAPLLLLFRRHQFISNNRRLKEKKNEDKKKDHEDLSMPRIFNQ